MIDFGLLLLGQQEAEEERTAALALAPWQGAAPALRRDLRAESAAQEEQTAASAAARVVGEAALLLRTEQLRHAAQAVQGVAARLLSAVPAALQGEGTLAAQGAQAEATPLFAATQARMRQVGAMTSLGTAGGLAAMQGTAAAPFAVPVGSVLALDRAMERDARRYDKGFTLY